MFLGTGITEVTYISDATMEVIRATELRGTAIRNEDGMMAAARYVDTGSAAVLWISTGRLREQGIELVEIFGEDELASLSNGMSDWEDFSPTSILDQYQLSGFASSAQFRSGARWFVSGILRDDGEPRGLSATLCWAMRRSERTGRAFIVPQDILPESERFAW